MRIEPPDRAASVSTYSDLVVALFTDRKSAHGAVADLRSAGIRRDRIAVAFSAEGRQAHRGEFEIHGAGPEDLSKSKYTLAWRLRRGFNEDLHHHGAEVLAGKQKDPADEVVDSHIEVDLQETLRDMGVAEDRIQLLNRIVGANGLLILVEAGDRSGEVQTILEKNTGQIRTDSATERPAPVTH